MPLLIICYRGTADVKFMLLHDGKSEDNVRSFFTEVHELYLKVTRTHRMHTKLANVMYGHAERLG